jgi:hypothetical protein
MANLQHFYNNNIIIILNYYYFITGLFLSHSWWAESCSVRLSRGMLCNRQPRSFQGVNPYGRPDGWKGRPPKDIIEVDKRLEIGDIYCKHERKLMGL